MKNEKVTCLPLCEPNFRVGLAQCALESAMLEKYRPPTLQEEYYLGESVLPNDGPTLRVSISSNVQEYQLSECWGSKPFSWAYSSKNFLQLLISAQRDVLLVGLNCISGNACFRAAFKDPCFFLCAQRVSGERDINARIDELR